MTQRGLLLFAGVPEEWLTPGARVAFRDFPTWYGAAVAELAVNSDGKSASVTLTGVAEATPVTVALPHVKVQGALRDGGFSLRVPLWPSGSR
jgi:hypothetical protein